MNAAVPILLLLWIPLSWIGIWMALRPLRGRIGSHQCACGYDRRGIPEASPCPECGGHGRRQRDRRGYRRVHMATWYVSLLLALAVGLYSNAREGWVMVAWTSLFVLMFVTLGLVPWLVVHLIASDVGRGSPGQHAVLGVCQGIGLLGSTAFVVAQFSKDAQGGLAILVLPFLTAGSGGLLALVAALVMRWRSGDRDAITPGRASMK